jgi:hypothetical protein
VATAFHTFLFGDHRIATATSGECEYGHSFGGPPDRKGTSREDCNGILIHLLHRLDLSDPAIPVAVPGVRWLPLYYCFDFRANELGYRLISEEEMVTFFPEDDPNVSQAESWPYADYPTEFPRSSIKVVAYDYDPTDLDDAFRWAGVFGIGRLSDRNRTAAKERTAELMDGLGLGVPETEEEFEEALSGPFMQGKPDGPCLNPTCANYRKRGQLTSIALMPAEPVKGVTTFGPLGGGVVLVFQLCPKCHTIRVSNQSD